MSSIPLDSLQAERKIKKAHFPISPGVLVRILFFFKKICFPHGLIVSRHHTGRHPCTGMKTAKLEIKVILTFMLAGFEFDVVDKFGKRPLELPQPNRNAIRQARPLGEPCYLQFKRTVE